MQVGEQADAKRGLARWLGGEQRPGTRASKAERAITDERAPGN
jgi:hypothetical protein